MAKKKSKNEISVSEFKSWISGIEDMQEDDWVPNKAQWIKIKAKIELLTDDYVEYAQPEQPMVNRVPNYPTYQQPPVPIYPSQSSAGLVSDIKYTNGDSPDFL